MADGVWNGVSPLVFGCSRQLSINKFLDPSTPSMRKVDNATKEKKECRFQSTAQTTTVETPHARAKYELAQFSPSLLLCF